MNHESRSGKIILLISILPLLAIGCNKKTTTVTIDGHTLQVQVAQTESERSQGLSGRESLAENDGMLFVFPTPSKYVFWMKDMKFPLDFIWIKDRKVVEITPNALTEPGVADTALHRYLPQNLVDSVLEVNAGWTAKNKIKVGDRVSVDVGP